MKSAEIRAAFLDFFSQQQHQIVPSSSLVPQNDATLLFTNAGMVPFKEVFLGQDTRPFNRAASSQRCVRAGGKHNDLENVGYTARHHTFFEMLGNFSFGDYFKREAICFAWQFLTQTLGLPPERLWVTVHISDDEAADIWLKEVGVSPERFSRLDEDNFWQMADTGPCGPSSEIFYDHGADVPGGPPGSENDDLDRYIEIWNLVFMQYERQTNGELIALPKPSVDTGMGLERIAAVMQGVHNNYDIDLFKTILASAAQVLNIEDQGQQSLRVIADHIRSCSFLIADGVQPSNVGRGYVLRRIIRRAVRHGNKLGADQPFFHKLVDVLAQEMGQAYPELIEKKALIAQSLLQEEEQFAKTLARGMKILEEALPEIKEVIPGRLVFTLYDTYGFPVDLTNDIARERGLSLDMDGYEVAMQEQQALSKEGDQFKVDYTKSIRTEGVTDFSGYDHSSSEATISAIFKDGQAVDTLNEGEEGVIVLAKTPFYAESGGQVADSGELVKAGVIFEVLDCQKNGDNHLHIGLLTSGSLRKGDLVQANIDSVKRALTAANHSATHLLHAALREILGTHVTQKGSLVDSQKLRFDFSHPKAMSFEEIRAIEHRVNQVIRMNTPVNTELCSMDKAKEKGAMALFGEKYGDEVRVLSMGMGFSTELCGGTHVQRTGDIGLFKIVSESGIASGVRRIEAIVGERAETFIDEAQSALRQLCQTLKATPETLVDKVESHLAQSKVQEKTIAQLSAKIASQSSQNILEHVKRVGDVQVLAYQAPGLDAKGLRDLADSVKTRLENGIFLLAGVNENHIALISGATKNCPKPLHAGKLMQHVAPILGGKGGGKPDMAQGAGNDPSRLKEALEAVLPWVEEQLT